jgi:catechol 2,3-dioxygenase-like lactoylglutathione lyase family enzyme
MLADELALHNTLNINVVYVRKLGQSITCLSLPDGEVAHRRTEGSMTTGQFRFAYFTPQYEATVAFYREGLELPVLETWDRHPDDRGTLFGAASGMIEVLALPRGGASAHLWDARPPQGAFMVIEVPDVEAHYQRAVAQGLPITQGLTDQDWGHRSFCIRDPNGLTLYFFREIGSTSPMTQGARPTGDGTCPVSPGA